MRPHRQFDGHIEAKLLCLGIVFSSLAGSLWSMMLCAYSLLWLVEDNAGHRNRLPFAITIRK